MDEFRLFTVIMAMIMSAVYQSAIAVSGSGNCEELPTIENSGNNITGIQYEFSEGTAVQFHCLQEYRMVGNGLYICSDSAWVGGNFSCLIKTCPNMSSPKHGKMIGNNYEIGSVMRYKCDIGYELIGSNTSQCKLDSQWHPPNVPECRIKKCPAAHIIEHGDLLPENEIEGYNNVYGSILRAKCNSGYMINGPVRINCNSKGKWSQIPECKPVSCPSYPGLDAKCVRKTTLVGKTLLIITCTANSITLEGERDGTTTCVNNMWDNLTIRCLCHCEIKADTDLVHIENLDSSGLLKHNETLEWSCRKGATKTFNDSVTCNDGLVEPQGWGCFIFSTASDDPVNGTDSGAVDKSRNENGDKVVALATWVKALIAVGGILLVIILALVVVYVALKRRGYTIFIVREKTDNQAQTANTGSETNSNVWCQFCGISIRVPKKEHVRFCQEDEQSLKSNTKKKSLAKALAEEAKEKKEGKALLKSKGKGQTDQSD